MDSKHWQGYVAVVTRGVTSLTPETKNIEAGFALVHDSAAGFKSLYECLAAIRMALASDVDLANELVLRQPDAVVREYLRALETRIDKFLGAFVKGAHRWPGYILLVAYGLTSPREPMDCIEPSLWDALKPRVDGPSPSEFLSAIRLALASDVDIADRVGLVFPDAVVRDYMRVLEGRLSKRLDEIAAKGDTTDYERLPMIVRELTYDFTRPGRVPTVQRAFMTINSANNNMPRSEILAAVRKALASDLDIAAQLELAHPDQVVREFLAAIETRLSKELGE